MTLEIKEREIIDFILTLLHHRRPLGLQASFTWQSATAKGTQMTFSMPSKKVDGSPSTVTVTVSPIKADGSPSQAALSNVQFTSTDTAVFTVAPNPSEPRGAVLTSVADGVATLNFSATAAEIDGRTNEVSGFADIKLTSAAAEGPATGLVAEFGTPDTGIAMPATHRRSK